MTQRVATKTRIQQLKSNVKTGESKLEKGIVLLNRAKQRRTKSQGSREHKTEWETLEKVVKTMEGLLVDYRRYALELEKQNAQLSAQSKANSDNKKASTKSTTKGKK